MISIGTNYTIENKHSNAITYGRHHFEGWALVIHQRDSHLTITFETGADLADFMEDVYASYKTLDIPYPPDFPQE